MKIGLEIHIALPTRSKLFCACSTSAERPNTAICPICMGFPGSKPMLNKEAVAVALGIANALHCKINERMSFVRKVYFYPDLPKSYQITQLGGSIGETGYLQYDKKRVGIRRVQVEEDPAKIVREGAYTLLDFNRSGMPLVEVVTDPDMRSQEELWGFLRTLRSILYYLGIDIDKEVKADLNVSVAAGQDRVEVKNVTGIKNMVEAAKFEEERQEQLVKEGEPVKQETRGYNEKKRATEAMREKETDEEYGYLYEPDLTVFDISKIRYKNPVYIDEVTHGLAEKYRANERTLKEITMFDSRSLERIERLKDRYRMQSIIHAIQRIKKFGREDISDSDFEKIINLIDSDVEITKYVISEVEKGREVVVKHAKLTEKELEKRVIAYIGENRHLLDDYRKNRKAANLIINDVSKRENLHPKEVSKKVLEILDKAVNGELSI
ncbi:MAG: Asp-tRNA(Asn)/Glu-tRNA(Gln) amidotransferase subunit GatB [Candidatus Marsarchaeota archaeon]|nr:Asp-tRNA(Asn)/Glu-tRNA(Gln) amidotransferase subunit GatB [Candidatus Marsarchaeota archaeon]